MANNGSAYLETALLNHVFRNIAYTPPDKIYVALHTADPTKADILSTEIPTTGTGYARQEVTFSAPVSESGIQKVKNLAKVTFPLATAAWGTITHATFRDAATLGNALSIGPLAVSKVIDAGDILEFNIGDLVIGLD